MKRNEIDDLIASALKGQGNQVDVSGKLPEILKGIMNAGGMPYSRCKKVGTYLYEMDFNNIDYDFGKRYMSEHYPAVKSLCTVVRNGGIIGRNLDAFYDDTTTIVVRVAPGNGRYASCGIISGIPFLTRQLLESGEYDDAIQAAPFFTVDAINEQGLFAEMNLLNRETSKGKTTGTVPAVELRDTIAMPMLVRYIVDHYASVDEAVAGIRDYVSVYATETKEFHYMLADSAKTVILEFVNNAVAVREVGGEQQYPAVLTNFYVDGVTPNVDGTITRNTSTDPMAVNQNGVTPYGSGIERHNIAVAGLSNADTTDAMDALMRSLFFTGAYTLTQNKWYSEFVGGELTVTSPDDSFADIMARAADAYESRSRENPVTWQTIHTAVYDIANRSLVVCVQEGNTYHSYAYDQIALMIDKVLANLPTALMVQSANNTTVGGYQVPALTVEQVQQAYNAVVSGRGCIIIDHDETMHAYVNQADRLNNELSIGILFYSYMLLTYTISNGAVVITHTEI